MGWNDAVEREELEDGTVVEIFPDTDPMDPRECDQLATLYCWHPDYELGDEQFTHDDHPDRSMEDIGRWLMNERSALFVIPLYLYDHSGISMSTGAVVWPSDDVPTGESTRTHNAFDPGGWDTTMVGFAYTTVERACLLGIPGTTGTADKTRVSNMRKLKEEAVRQVEAEVKEYDQYISGDAYGYVITDPEGEQVDSCWGFFGCDYVKQEAMDAAKHVQQSHQDELREREEWEARGVTTNA